MKLVFGFVILVALLGFASPSPLRREYEIALLDGLKQTHNDLGQDPPLDETTISAANTSQGEEAAGLFEGDIALTDYDKAIVDLSETGDVDGPLLESPDKRNAMRINEYRKMWMSRQVPYVINADLTSQGSYISQAISRFHTSLPCVTWRQKRTSDVDYVHFVKKVGCWSSVGRKGGEQELSLGEGCYNVGTIQHEMMHALGFWHEQSRPDRNQYVEVMWENVLAGKAHNFNKYAHTDVDVMELPYDYDSIMHYGKAGFSIYGKNTLRRIGDANAAIGQRNSFSSNDVIKMNRYFSCNATDGGWSEWSTFTPCNSAEQKHRNRFCMNTDPAACNSSYANGIQTNTVTCSWEEMNVPVDGHWGRWSAWGTCSTTCNTGTRTRSRVCDDPTPRNDGNPCSGDSTQAENCYKVSCNAGPDDCEFEDSGAPLCHWTQVSIDTMMSFPDWIHWTGLTPSDGTGPTGDHTPAVNGKGYYIYAEASGSSQTGQYVRLISKAFPATSGRCMSFWYYMKGDSMGTLNMYVQNKNTGALSGAIFTRTGDQGSNWLNGKASVPSTSYGYKIVLEAVRGSSWSSDIALDDITFHDGACATK